MSASVSLHCPLYLQPVRLVEDGAHKLVVVMCEGVS